MKSLRQYIRNLLIEAMNTPSMLPADVVIVIADVEEEPVEIYYAVIDSSTGEHHRLRQNDRVYAYLSGDSKSKVWGDITIEEIDEDVYGECEGAMNVGSAAASSGWGPLLYDVAIEYATLKANGLTPDRDGVSQEASHVWNYYLRNRKDVQAHQLDNLSSSLGLSMGSKECDQDVSIKDTGENSSWWNSPLSKRYTKAPTTINALKPSGKLVIL